MPRLLILPSPTFRIPPTKDQARQMRERDPQDCMIPAEYMLRQDQALKQLDFSGAEYVLSPIEFSWRGLPPMYVIYGSCEILLAQLEEAREKAAAEGVVMHTCIGEGMMHTWTAAGFLPEAKQMRGRIYALLRGEREEL